MNAYVLKPNYYALCACIVSEIDTERALSSIVQCGAQKKYRKISPDEEQLVRHMQAMRDRGATYQQIANKFGVNFSYVYTRTHDT